MSSFLRRRQRRRRAVVHRLGGLLHRAFHVIREEDVAARRTLFPIFPESLLDAIAVELGGLDVVMSHDPILPGRRRLASSECITAIGRRVGLLQRALEFLGRRPVVGKMIREQLRILGYADSLRLQ